MIKYRSLLWLLVVFIPQEGDQVVCDYVDCAICEKNRAFTAIESADTILIAQYMPLSENVSDEQKGKNAHFSVKAVFWGNRDYFAPETNLTLQSLCAEVNQCQLFLLVGHSGDRRVWHEPVLLNSEEVPRIASLVSLIRGTNLNQKVIDDLFNLIHTATPDVAAEAVAAAMKCDIGVWNRHRNMLPHKGLRTLCEDKVLESPSDAVLLMLLALCRDSRDLTLVQEMLLAFDAERYPSVNISLVMTAYVVAWGDSAVEFIHANLFAKPSTAAESEYNYSRQFLQNAAIGSLRAAAKIPDVGLTKDLMKKVAATALEFPYVTLSAVKVLGEWNAFEHIKRFEQLATSEKNVETQRGVVQVLYDWSEIGDRDPDNVGSIHQARETLDRLRQMHPQLVDDSLRFYPAARARQR